MCSEAKASSEPEREPETPTEACVRARSTGDDPTDGRSDADAEPTPTVTEPETAADDIAALKASLGQAREEIEELKDRALRAAAEVENVRRRAERSIENAAKFALEKFVADLLPAVDSFERAVEAASGPSPGQGEAAGSAMAEGLELSLKLLVGAMERQGIAVVDPIGAPFDPNLHEAMTMVDNAEVEPGSVIQVFQKGYTVNGRLTRPARVLVARQPAADAANARETDA